MKKIKTKAKLSEVRKLVGFVVDFAVAAGMEDEAVQDIKLAVEELVVNVVSYAYGDGEGDIEIECFLEGGSVSATIIDSGQSFDPTSKSKKKPPSIDEAQEGGMGIILASNLLDEFTYRREKDQNILTLRKNLTI